MNNLDTRVRRAVMPTRILWESGDVRQSDFLLRHNSGQALIHGAPCATLSGKNASILLDFGRELHGGVQLVTGPFQGYGPVRVRLRFGESVSEAMGQPLNHHAIGDLEIAIPFMASQEFGQTGFRFLRIDVLDDLELPLIACRAMTLMRELPQVGSFACSDERLNRIWQVGADTVHLCLQDFVWDGIKRDRAVWIGDLHPEAAVVSAVWGEADIVPGSLDWARDHTPLPAWMNGIGSYSMWWVILQRDWFLHWGNRAYLEQQRDYLIRLLPILCEQIGSQGEVSWRGRKFLDWPSSENPAAVDAGLCALLVLALQAGAQLCAVLGEDALARDTLEVAARIETPALPVDSKQASALLALSGRYEAADVNARVLSQKPLEGISTFYGFYVLQARAAAGDYAGALGVIRRYWGAMLDLGATSFWEDFDLSWADNATRIDEMPEKGKSDLHFERGAYCYKSWRHSLCHGWAAGPTAWLSQHVLGVSPLEPGCKKVSLRPHLEDLSWAQGTFPTPHGPLTVRHERTSSGIESHIEAPEGVVVIR